MKTPNFFITAERAEERREGLKRLKGIFIYSFPLRSLRTLRFLGFICMMVFLCGFAVYADEVSNSELLKRIERLEEENRILKARLDEMAAKRYEFIEEREEEREEEKEMCRLNLRGFADITYTAQRAGNRIDEEKNKFLLGQVALHLSSDLSDRISIFNEDAIQIEDTNDTKFDIERVIIKYTLSDLLKIEVGRVHTPIGYWNQMFHHGRFLQTTVSRPEIYGFEDESPGGVLPIHNVGIQFSGALERFTHFDADYYFGIFNGRANTRTKVQMASDGNDSKALNGMLSITPDFFSGLKLGMDIYSDKIPAGTTAPRLAEIDELIFGGFITYFKDNLELICEYHDIKHDDEASKNKYDTEGFFIQTAYQFDKLKPYYRFEHINFANGDPYYSSIDKDTQKHTLGIRYDVATFNTIKLEYGYLHKETQSDIDSITLNTSFAF